MLGTVVGCCVAEEASACRDPLLWIMRIATHVKDTGCTSFRMLAVIAVSSGCSALCQKSLNNWMKGSQIGPAYAHCCRKTCICFIFRSTRLELPKSRSPSAHRCHCMFPEGSASAAATCAASIAIQCRSFEKTGASQP